MSSDQIHQSGLNVILDAQARLARTQEELASGKRILNPSDDPVASAQIQSVKSELTRIETLQKNISHATSELAMVEDSVANIEGVLMRARELAVRGANDSLSAQDRDVIATEIDTLREQLIAAANTQSSDGDYIFAGYAVAAAPYTDATVNATYSGGRWCQSH
jgi:flagellar hook-associated protein 3 FlgL